MDMDPAFPSLSEWTRRRRTAASRAWVIVLVMLGLLGLHAQGQPGAAFAIVCLGAALAWVVGVRLVALEMLLVDLGRRRRRLPRERPGSHVPMVEGERRYRRPRPMRGAAPVLSILHGA